MLLKKKPTLEYEREGSGPLIIFFILPQVHQTMEFIINLLKNEFEIIALNLFGYGLTSKWNENNSPQTLSII